jgi:hypothetical protein
LGSLSVYVNEALTDPAQFVSERLWLSHLDMIALLEHPVFQLIVLICLPHDLNGSVAAIGAFKAASRCSQRMPAIFQAT